VRAAVSGGRVLCVDVELVVARVHKRNIAVDQEHGCAAKMVGCFHARLQQMQPNNRY
jgi:hypothetical protein